jgi:hypothetical protein
MRCRMPALAHLTFNNPTTKSAPDSSLLLGPPLSISSSDPSDSGTAKVNIIVGNGRD